MKIAHQHFLIYSSTLHVRLFYFPETFIVFFFSFFDVNTHNTHTSKFGGIIFKAFVDPNFGKIYLPC